MSEELSRKVDKLHSWVEDNGSWGAKTKLAQLWDWFSHRKVKEAEIDKDVQELWEKVDMKLDKTECTVKHDKLIADIEKMLNARDTSWKYWVEQIKWLLPTAILIGMYLHEAGVITR